MRFSIITVTFNAKEFLEKTLESVAAQEFKDYEHLIWDGGSSDSTLDIAEKFGVKIYQGKDDGIADAMNKGAAHAQGDILLHLHADDFLAHPKALSFVDTAFKQHPHRQWLYGQAYTVNKEGKTLSCSRFRPFCHSRLKKYNTITHPATFILRSLFEEAGGFDPTLRYCMDYELWLRLAQKAEPLALFAPLACFRAHEGSLSTKEKRGVADEAYAVRNRFLHTPWERLKSYKTWRKRLETCT